MQGLPIARGPLSLALLDALASNDLAKDLDRVEEMIQETFLLDTDILFDEDLQLALFVLYELHYSGFDTLTDDWEWHPPILALRRRLEERFETRLRDALGELPVLLRPRRR